MSEIKFKKEVMMIHKNDDTLTPHVLLWAETSYRTDVNWDKR